MASIADASLALAHLEMTTGNVRNSLAMARFDEVASGLVHMAEQYDAAIALTEQCVVPELAARVALSNAIERAKALGLSLEDISEIYSDEIDRRI
jgi:propanediol dehydratase small subunit